MSLFASKGDEDIKPLEELLKETKDELTSLAQKVVLGDKKLNQVAALTYNDKICDKIMSILEKSIVPESFSWLVLYKSILVLHTIVRFGSDRALQRCVSLYRFIYPLQDYNSALVKKGLFGSTGGRDFGEPVRREAKALATVLRTDETMQSYRTSVNDGLDTLVPLGESSNSGSSFQGEVNDDLSCRSTWPSISAPATSSSGRDVFDDLDFLSSPSSTFSTTSSTTSSSSFRSSATTSNNSINVLDLFDNQSSVSGPSKQTPYRDNLGSTSGSSSSSSSNNSYNNSYNSNNNSNSSSISNRSNVDLLDIFGSSSSGPSLAGSNTKYPVPVQGLPHPYAADQLNFNATLKHPYADQTASYNSNPNPYHGNINSNFNSQSNNNSSGSSSSSSSNNNSFNSNSNIYASNSGTRIDPFNSLISSVPATTTYNSNTNLSSPSFNSNPIYTPNPYPPSNNYCGGNATGNYSVNNIMLPTSPSGLHLNPMSMSIAMPGNNASSIFNANAMSGYYNNNYNSNNYNGNNNNNNINGINNSMSSLSTQGQPTPSFDAFEDDLPTYAPPKPPPIPSFPPPF